MRESPLRQLIFDRLLQGLAVLDLLDKSDLLAIALGLERSDIGDASERQLFNDVARAIREYEKRGDA